MSEAAQWTVVGLSSSLGAGAVRGTRIHGTLQVLWRARSGEAHLWPDRCPHRGMRLSFGCVRDNHLACVYHGFRFDGDGQCRHVPAHPDFTPPASMAVLPYVCIEADGWLWANATQINPAHLPGSPDSAAGKPPVTGRPDDVLTAIASVWARASTGIVHATLQETLLRSPIIPGPHAHLAYQPTDARTKRKPGRSRRDNGAIAAEPVCTNVLRWRINSGEKAIDLTVALQPLDSGSTMIHARAEGPETLGAAARNHLFNILLHARDAAEASVANTGHGGTTHAVTAAGTAGVETSSPGDPESGVASAQMSDTSAEGHG
ncbi:MAG: phenylpropionate dioxygenase-like ring-hydroxylating dioxygenase large terminal subunit [Gammaproteobacteria bacterium]|jgi:phenylpropionate dioxygenase-like ring-hydroxylating dioxygenase large terminal subunit